MPLPAIIAAIMQLLGPLLSDLLKQWLDGRLKAEAAKLDPGIRTAPAGAAELLGAVEDSLWFFQRAKLRFVREARASCVPALAAGRTSLRPTEAGAVKAAALAAGGL